MKKYFIAFIPMALIIGFSSFSKLNDDSKQASVIVKEKQVSLYWFVGQNYTGRQNTHTNEVAPSGCPDTGTAHCEDGYDGNDFNTVNNPFSGLKPGATINDVIEKP